MLCFSPGGMDMSISSCCRCPTHSPPSLLSLASFAALPVLVPGNGRIHWHMSAPSLIESLRLLQPFPISLPRFLSPQIFSAYLCRLPIAPPMKALAAYRLVVQSQQVFPGELLINHACVKNLPQGCRPHASWKTYLPSQAAPRAMRHSGW